MLYAPSSLDIMLHVTTSRYPEHNCLPLQRQKYEPELFIFNKKSSSSSSWEFYSKKKKTANDLPSSIVYGISSALPLYKALLPASIV